MKNTISLPLLATPPLVQLYPYGLATTASPILAAPFASVFVPLYQQSKEIEYLDAHTYKLSGEGTALSAGVYERLGGGYVSSRGWESCHMDSSPKKEKESSRFLLSENLMKVPVPAVATSFTASHVGT